MGNKDFVTFESNVPYDIEYDKTEYEHDESCTLEEVSRTEKRHPIFFWKKTYTVTFQREDDHSKKNELLEKLRQTSNLPEETFEAPMENEAKQLDSLGQDLEENEWKKKTEKMEQQMEQFEKMMKAMMGQQEEGVSKEAYPKALEGIRKELIRMEVDEKLVAIMIDQIKEEVEDVENLDKEALMEKVLMLVESNIQTRHVIEAGRDRVIALVGATGVGKTTTIGKIGWNLWKENKKVGFITTDSFRTAAMEQLDYYAKRMDAKTVMAKNVDELKEAMHYMINAHNVDHVLIDTVGRNPMEEGTVPTVKEYLEVASPDVTCLVLSATSKTQDLQAHVEKYRNLPLNGLIITKLDETINKGSLLKVLRASRFPLMYVANGQQISGSLYAPTSSVVARTIVEGDVPLEGKVVSSGRQKIG